MLCLAELISDLRQNSDISSEIEEFIQVSQDKDLLRDKVQKLLLEYSDMKSSNQALKTTISGLVESKANKELAQLRSQITELQRNIENVEHRNRQLSGELSNERNRSSKYRQSDTEYHRLNQQYNDLIHKYNTLQNQVASIPQITQENEKLKKSKQDLEKRVQEIEQELQEAQQKLSVATTRLRGLNINPNLAGGGSRSDQLKNEFSHLKMGLFHEASSKVLNGWRERGSTLTFRSEEFSKIKSILSERVFCGGMAYFAKDKAEIDTELHLIMEVLSGIEDFSLTPPISQKIQARIQAGLLSSKGVDNSDQALTNYANKATTLIDQDLRQITNCKTTGEALAEILKFAESGLRLVRDIVNDPNSGELFIPENGAAFDESSHETRDENRVQIKMTVCAGYRVAGNVLVKADVITCDSEPLSKKKEMNTALNISNEPQEESNQQSLKSIEDEKNKNKDHEDDKKSLPQEINIEHSSSIENQSLDSQNNHQKENPKDENHVESQKTDSRIDTTFSGKVMSNSGVDFCIAPRNDARTQSEAGYDDKLNFEGWTNGDKMVGADGTEDDRWYKVAGQDFWVPACFIDGEPPSNLSPMTIEGGGDESK
ncbi:MAG: hypothetical protein EAZ60_17030 [Oscillatoriales cyanobacterium]|nr:MAG: hypothetical protein EAZ83_12610 [Oscillatoriales cyanobacterium]TAF00146.1 MAG: hypothetical protein EAZ79_03690 [Oscillatoriales cyanobacterium]TAF19705.1 MAG: hypothetical protein EAZ73_14285 [Oscillatoriales cyanobacterium]TAF39096.1 MAG: hypothetical protein EAZ69_02055 [Oscillatoriales cyanobacterium]TAF54257.1 MAG: hypothetical protein EAZ60_17030 [Oscillatoriales cyanobacterium]